MSKHHLDTPESLANTSVSSSSQNLSEKLFDNNNKQAKETSSLTFYMPNSQSMLEENSRNDGLNWYRTLRRFQWSWLGIDPIEQEQVLSAIAASTHARSHEQWIDTVMGYHSGNWTYEWIKQGMVHQAKANVLLNAQENITAEQENRAAEEFFNAALFFSIASYPHLKGDSLSIQAQMLANQVFNEGIKHSQYIVKPIDIPYLGKKVRCHLHLSSTEKSQPVVVVCGGVDSLQTDMWRLFRDYFAPKNIAMLTIDMPAVGASSNWLLTEDSSCLYQAIVEQIGDLPWVDHFNIGLFGIGFGGNIATRLAFLEQNTLKACVCLNAPLHDLFATPAKLKLLPKMYWDTWSSRIGRNTVDVESLAGQMKAWSLKAQGFLSNRKTQVPILAMSFEDNPMSPYTDNHLVQIFSRNGKAKKIKRDSQSEAYEKSIELAIEWFEEAFSA